MKIYYFMMTYHVILAGVKYREHIFITLLRIASFKYFDSRT